MRVLLDTNIVLDVLLDRAPFVVSAKDVWQRVEAGQVRASLTATTLTNIFYIVRKAKGLATARSAVADLLTTFSVCAVDDVTLRVALTKPMRDYEDAVQEAVAEMAGIPIIVTRNKEDYVGSRCRILDAAELVLELDRITT